MVEGVQERGRQRNASPVVCASLAQEGARTEAEHDDADVLDRVEREQQLELVLEDRIDDPDHRRCGTRGENEDAEPGRQYPDPLDEHADEPVDRDLDHHAAHERRDMRRGDRVRLREPDVKRDEARLRSHPDEGGEGDRDLRARPASIAPPPPKASAFARRSTATQVPAP